MQTDELFFILITSKLNLQLKSISMDSNDGIFEGQIKINVQNQAELVKIIDEIKKISGVKKAERMK